ncbi:MAG: phosphodiester glycosidase family protein [Cyanobacteria bacterium]|nr:phosphodiester glycosidase family protein [Cyanobacteriota bacterium]
MACLFRPSLLPLPLMSVVLGWGLMGCSVPATDTIAPAATAPQTVTYAEYEHPTSRIHVVTVPANYRLGIAVSEALMPLADLVVGTEAIAAINAGFFDPQNGLTTSYVTLGDGLAADPRLNPRLVDNPDLQAYLPAILDRSEFRIYDCGGEPQYEIVRHSAPLKADCTLSGAVGAGPQLLPVNTGYEEGFLTNNAAGEVVRDALGSRTVNARSAVGLTATGEVVLAIAAQRQDIPMPNGLTGDDFAAFLAELGVVSALNLDGGSSSTLMFEGQIHLARLNQEGVYIERPIKSILFVASPAQ